jgi:hypothetical protein
MRLSDTGVALCWCVGGSNTLDWDHWRVCPAQHSTGVPTFEAPEWWLLLSHGRIEVPIFRWPTGGGVGAHSSWCVHWRHVLVRGEVQQPQGGDYMPNQATQALVCTGGSVQVCVTIVRSPQVKCGGAVSCFKSDAPSQCLPMLHTFLPKPAEPQQLDSGAQRHLQLQL